jgi:hypothetical protein
MREIVAMSKMPNNDAMNLLDSTILYLCKDISQAQYITDVAHIRLNMSEDYQDAGSQLVDWLLMCMQENYEET